MRKGLNINKSLIKPKNWDFSIKSKYSMCSSEPDGRYSVRKSSSGSDSDSSDSFIINRNISNKG